MKAAQTQARYDYCRDRDGCDDTFDIWDTHTGRHIGSISFWDSVPGEEAEAEQQARAIVAELNAKGPRNVRAFDDVA